MFFNELTVFCTNFPAKLISLRAVDPSQLFTAVFLQAWAKHSGRYRAGIDKPEPIVWKTRLRCALNKMPDIRELPERSRLDVSEPYRVYQLLPPVHKGSILFFYFIC